MTFLHSLPRNNKHLHTKPAGNRQESEQERFSNILINVSKIKTIFNPFFAFRLRGKEKYTQKWKEYKKCQKHEKFISSFPPNREYACKLYIFRGDCS